MVSHYIKLALRSIISQGHQSLISAIGLSVALSCSILILLYIQYELSYDRFHKNADHIYRVVQRQPNNSYMGKNLFAVTAGPLKEALVNEIPEILNSTKCKLQMHTLEYNSSLFTERDFLYTDPDFLKIFSFPVILGDPAKALSEPFNLIITKEMASKYFGDEDPLGKTIIADNKYSFTIAGVMDNIPDNTHLDFDFITGFETMYSMRGGKENVENWNSNSYITYFQLRENSDPEIIKTKLNELNKKYTKNNTFTINSELIPEPLNGIHLGGKINFEPGNNNDIRYIYMISSIGILIILIACFNYMNMATARSYTRGREIGILKVAGCSKRDLVIQFLTESVLLSAAGLILAFIIIWLVLPVFSGFTERPLRFRMIMEYQTLIRIILLMLIAGLLAGFYPAFYLASFSPLQLINEGFKNRSINKRSGKLRNMLVVLQYIISIVALICTFTLLRQLNFIKNADLGFKKDNIITIRLNDPAIRTNPAVLIQELRADSKIEDITISTDLPVTIGSNSRGRWDGKQEETILAIYKAGMGNNFIDFYDLKIISGRGFSDDFSADTINKFIINQTAVKSIGWDDPLGKRFGYSNDMGIVVGVIEDFHFHSLRLPVEPLALSAVGSKEFRETSFISIKVKPGSLLQVRLFAEKKLKELSPHYINQVSILSDRIDSIYSSDRKLALIFIFSTILAVILTCLGQYSLSSYTTRSRTKEMVIRKVMGSHPSGIMAILTGEMAKWILISIVFAWPVSYLIMNRWLQDFAYHINIGAGVFIASLFIILLISVSAVSCHIIKLSKMNPSEMIRHE